MILSDVISESYYGSVGHISSQKDIDTLRSYISHNFSILQRFENIIAVTNYPDSSLNSKLYLASETENLWKEYFPNSIQINNGASKGHYFGAAYNDNSLFNYCKENNIEWLCKSANDIILFSEILDKHVEEADFYYLNGIGYGGMERYNFDLDKIILETFYPQTNFYILNVSKTNYLNDKTYLDQAYDHIKTIPNYNGKAWEYGYKSNETLLKEAVERNNLLKYHLISEEKYVTLLQFIKQNHIHDCSHKNILIDGVCHCHFINNQIIKI